MITCGTIVLLIDNAAESGKRVFLPRLLLFLALIKFSFLAAGLASLMMIVNVWFCSGTQNHFVHRGCP